MLRGSEVTTPPSMQKRTKRVYRQGYDILLHTQPLTQPFNTIDLHSIDYYNMIALGLALSVHQVPTFLL